MRYGSVCSGIEAATVAWHPLGWTPAFFSEIEPFPRAVLTHHYPEVPLHGDFTTIEKGRYGPIELLVGGTPCQSFSVAGLRGGLGDNRGNLALEFLRLADRERPRWVVWENVPGVLSSNGGRDFGAILGGLVELGYGWAYRVLDAQYVRVDELERAVPQRRRRVFVVGYLGDWRRAAAVLFERESLSGGSAPRRGSRKYLAPTLSARTRGGGGLGTDFEVDGGLIAQPVAPALDASFGRLHGTDGQSANHGHAHLICAPVSPALKARDSKGPSSDGDGDGDGAPLVAHSLRAEGFDASEDGTGRGTPIVPVMASGAAGAHPPALAWAIGSHAGAADGDATNRSHTHGGPTGLGIQEGVAYSLRAGRVQSLATRYAVRRLTPRECDRLQGFEDDYTAIPWRGRPAEECPDGPRYKALGNSMAVNVMRWIGQRIELVERMTEDLPR